MNIRGRRARVVALAALLSGCGDESTSGTVSDDAGAPPAGGTAGAGASGGSVTAGGTSGAAGATGGGGNNTGGLTSTGGTAGAGGSSGSGGMGGTAGAGGTGGMLPCGAIATFESGRSPASEIHVAMSGSDTAGDGSAGNPYASIDRAAAAATPGAAIIVHAGTYAGGAYIEGLAGTADAPIWIGGAEGEARPIVDGGADAMHLVGARYVIVHDLEIQNQTANGINADDGDDRANVDASRYLVFRNLSIHDIGAGGNQDCLKLSGINDYFVLDSNFARCGGGSSGSGIDHVGCHAGLIARNTFSDMLAAGNAVQCKGGSEDIEIRWNLITDGGQRAVNMGGSTGFEFFRPPLSMTAPNAEARNIRVIANVIVGGTAALAFVGCVDCLAANNTIIDPDNWILRILQETTTGGGYTFLEAQNGRFVNNLVYFARGALSTYVNVGAGTRPDTFTFENNLWYAHDDVPASTPTDLPVMESQGIYGLSPSLGNPASGDYSIDASSPAAGAGIAVAELSGDMTGACFAEPPSIGAFEVP